MKKGMLFRIIGSLIVVIGFFLVNRAINIVDPIVAGNLAVKQLEHSDVAYATGQFGMGFFNGRSVTIWLPILLLVAIWWSPIKALIFKAKNETVAAIIFMFVFSILGVPKVFAYYDTQDKPEYVEIQPNESVFLVPLTGDNKKSQAKFMSVDYLNENKQATKRIQIPHTLMKVPGLNNRNYYIPAAKAIIVDRTPYHREWRSAADKGTSTKNQGFEFESRDSVNISTGLTTAAYVKEEDAAKFTYWFGVKPGGDANAPEGKFASVSRGYSLTEVMDTYVRGMVQRTIAKEFGKRDFTDCLHDKVEIVEKVEKEVKDAFAAKGITIDYIGLAEQLNFADKIQTKINEVIEARLDVLRFDSLTKMLPLKAKEADIKIKEAAAETLKKWDGKIPWYMPEWLVNLVAKWMK